MTNALIAYLNLTPAQRGYVLEHARQEENALLEITESPIGKDTDRASFFEQQADALQAAQRLLEDATKLCYQSSVPKEQRHRDDSTLTKLIQVWVLCPKLERDALLGCWRNTLGSPEQKATYVALADFLEVVSEGLS